MPQTCFNFSLCLWISDTVRRFPADAYHLLCILDFGIIIKRGIIRELGTRKKRSLIEDFEVLHFSLTDDMVPDGTSYSQGKRPEGVGCSA